ncbi:nuclear pore complex subunit Nup159 [Paecilomyces variotii No. 5]|uniref:Nuclear pore complex subunit Nup159 n=1 Tax=Byssochlamys spectabilis (strain No. 5 / NBRC 109023) TaxID=1356009 RepID=V5FV65_BYSSN|nr:nuclear pore complex subunit Nup159 [Paecilomyces variotii No. 5]
MAFSFGAANPSAGGGGNVPAELGPELPEVFTEEVGFKGVESDSRIRLLPNPWPEDALPSPTASLLTVAPTKGIVVGGGPDGLFVAKTDAVRQAIAASQPEEDAQGNKLEKVKTKPFEPQAKIALSAKPTHIAFAAGESALVVATEKADQLLVYDTATLLQSNAQPAISIAMGGVPLRTLVPNPAPAAEVHSSLVALVNTNGELSIANLKAGALAPGPGGPVLKNGVSCVSWSNLGKQLVAGLADGTGYQMTPEGEKKDEIPRPPELEGDQHISAISWLENHVFFIAYTPSAAEDDMGSVPPSNYYIVTRRKGSPYLFQKLPEVCTPFGLKRSPAFQFIARLRDFKPHLKEALVLSSTASTDIGLITKADQPLAAGLPDEQVGLYSTTVISNDARTATLPMTDATMEDTSTIGLAVDLSATEKVPSPIAGEDITESETPLPNILVLNNDGILLSWWFVYSESVRQKIPYHGLAIVAPAQPQTQTSAQAQAPAASPFGASAQQPQQSAFGQPSFGTTSPFGKPAAPSFGSPSSLGGNRQSSFGTPSALGGGSLLGSTSPMGAAAPGFGSTSVLGSRPPQFGQSGFGGMQSSTPAFGKPSFGQPSFGQSSFGQPSTPGKGFSAFASTTPAANAPAGGGFSSFANSGGFASLGASKPAEQSPFAKAAGESPFGKATGESPFAKAAGENPFGKPAGQSVFGQPTETKSIFGAPSKPEESKGSFGLGGSGFVLGSGFKGDGTAANDAPKPDQGSSVFSMGSSFENMLGPSTSKPSPPTESMDDMESEPTAAQPEKTPAPAPAFGAPEKTSTMPSVSTGSLFGSQLPKEPSPTAAKSPPFSLFGNIPKQQTSPPSTPSEKTRVPSVDQKDVQKADMEATPTNRFEEPPLPPDAMSRAPYAPGDTSASSNVSKSSMEDAPLPPDFITKPKRTEPLPAAKQAPLPSESPTEPKKSESPPQSPVEEAPLPPDFLSKPKKAHSPSRSPAGDAPLPSGFLSQKKSEEAKEEAVPLPDGSEADESEFDESGEEVTHELSPTDEQADKNTRSFKMSPESSFGGLSDKSLAGGAFTKISMPEEQKQQTTRPLFGEIANPLIPAPRPVRTPRSPSPRRPGSKMGLPRSDSFRSASAPGVPGSALATRKAALAESSRGKQWEPLPSDIAKEEQERAAAAAEQRLSEEAQQLEEDDEDERLRADLARPLSPTPTLDPFVPHQDYMGQTAKPGIPGQIERLYRDINSMIDTLGINSRSLSSFLLYQENSKESDSQKWISILQGDNPANILDEKLLLPHVNNFDECVAALEGSLEQQRLRGVQEKLEQCQQLLSKDIFVLRGQCASIQKILDAHNDTVAVLSAPLSAEQASLQQDLRKASTALQAKLADLEQAISLLRAKIADAPRLDGTANASLSRRQTTRKPTVEAVTSTIATMMSMAESKSGDIDLLESQLKKLGIDVSGPPASHEGSPFVTPSKKTVGRFPATPGSHDGSRSMYHTPESTAHGLNFRGSVNGSSRLSMLRSVNGAGDAVGRQQAEQWKTKAQRRREIVGNLKKAVGERKVQVRGVDDL